MTTDLAKPRIKGVRHNKKVMFRTDPPPLGSHGVNIGMNTPKAYIDGTFHGRDRARRPR